MASLRPLDAELTRECREFAEALRALFGVLDVSVRRYGTRVPPWSKRAATSWNDNSPS